MSSAHKAKANAKAKAKAEAPRAESPFPSGKRRAPAAAGDGGAGRQKKKKKAHSTSDVAAAQWAAAPASAGALHPFEHDPADDCETCFQAYQVCMLAGQRPDTRYDREDAREDDAGHITLPAGHKKAKKLRVPAGNKKAKKFIPYTNARRRLTT
jgi:hypothetical protein